jgi:hypothetical protein
LIFILQSSLTAKKRGLDGKIIDNADMEMIGSEFDFLDENDEMMTLEDEQPSFFPSSRNSICGSLNQIRMERILGNSAGLILICGAHLFFRIRRVPKARAEI